MLDASAQRFTEPFDGPIDGRIYVRFPDAYSERARGLKTHRHQTGDLVAGTATVRVTQHDPNPTDASRVARQDGEHAIFSVGTGLSVDRVVTVDDSNSIHTQGDRKAQAKQAMQERLKAADANNDGYIDRQEADAHLPRVAKNFDKLDTDKDARLSTDELRQAADLARRRFNR